MTTITKKNPVEKITYAQAFTAVLDVLHDMNPDEVLTTVSVGKDTTAPLTVATAIDRIEKQIANYGKKSSAPKKPSTASIQNKEFAELLMAHLNANPGVGFTAAELSEVEGMPDGCNSSKISAIAKYFPDTVMVEKVKGRNVYSMGVAETEME